LGPFFSFSRELIKITSRGLLIVYYQTRKRQITTINSKKTRGMLRVCLMLLLL